MIHIPPGEKVSAKATGKTKNVRQVICVSFSPPPNATNDDSPSQTFNT